MNAMTMKSSSDTASFSPRAKPGAGGMKRCHATAADSIVASTPGQKPPNRTAMMMAG
jgi:hypothetical protein